MKKAFALMALAALAAAASAPVDSIHIIPPAPPHALTLKEREALQAVLAPLKGRSILALRMKELSLKLQKAAPKKRPILKRSLLGSLQLSFEQPEAVFLILRPNGELLPVFIDGALGAPVKFSNLTDRPIARQGAARRQDAPRPQGARHQDTAPAPRRRGAARASQFEDDPQLRREAALLLQSVPKDEGALSRAAISEIAPGPERESWIFRLSSHHFSVEVKAPLPPSHRKNISFVLSYLAEKEKRGLYIDARSEERIIARQGAASGFGAAPAPRPQGALDSSAGAAPAARRPQGTQRPQGTPRLPGARR